MPQATPDSISDCSRLSWDREQTANLSPTARRPQLVLSQKVHAPEHTRTPAADGGVHAAGLVRHSTYAVCDWCRRTIIETSGPARLSCINLTAWTRLVPAISLLCSSAAIATCV
jgi:hypothetical protein